VNEVSPVPPSVVGMVSVHDGTPADVICKNDVADGFANFDNVFVADEYKISPVAYVVCPVPP
jgi:hypothetical protein